MKHYTRTRICHPATLSGRAGFLFLASFFVAGVAALAGGNVEGILVFVSFIA